MEAAIALLVLGLTGSLAAQADQQARPTLVVQLVDPGWTPVTRVTVNVTRAKTCKPRPVRLGQPVAAETDGDGFARFYVPDDANYILEVSRESGWLHDRKCVRIFRRAEALPTAYVQIQVRDPTIVVQIGSGPSLDFSPLRAADRVEIRTNLDVPVKTSTDPSEIRAALEFIEQYSSGWRDPAAGPPFMLATVFTQSEKPVRVPTMADLAIVWVGQTSPNGLEYFRMELERSGAGLLTVQYSPEAPAVAYRVRATKLSRYDITFDLVPIDRNAQPIRLSGTATPRRLALAVRSDSLGWRRELVLQPYEQLMKQLKTVTDRAALAKSPG